MDSHALWNLASYSAQLACVAVVGGLALRLLQVDAAAVRYASWRALLALALALPWLQRRQPVVPLPVRRQFSSSLSVPSGIGDAATSAAEALFDWSGAIATVLVAGIVLRLVWIAVGLWRLRRLRTAGTPASDDEHYEELQSVVGARAELRLVPDLAQPATFGVRRPVILLPDSIRDQPRQVRDAVICHELLHVRRHDWLWALVEEVSRAVLWFHPAMWWLVSRVQLAREEAVDELTILATGGRRRAYLEALMTFAEAAPVAPAAALIGRRHLFRRMMVLSKEAVMSSKRVVFSCAATVLIVLAGSWYAVDAFPMTQVLAPSPILARAMERLQQRAGGAPVAAPSQPGPLERTAKAVTPENPIPRRTYGTLPLYPNVAEPDVRLLVSLRLTIDQTGRVAEVRQLGGGPAGSIAGGGRRGPAAVDPSRGATFVPVPTDAFVRAAIEAARQWVYDPPISGPVLVDVVMAFDPAANEAQLVSHGSVAPLGVIGGVRGGVAGARGGAPGRTATPGTATAPPPPPPPPPPGTAAPDAACAGAIRVGGALRPPTRVTNVNPIYPPIAQAANVQGVVILESCIDATGHVAGTRVLRSIPLLDQAAIDAVSQWEYTPVLLNGQPVPIVMTMTVNFTLQQ